MTAGDPSAGCRPRESGRDDAAAFGFIDKDQLINTSRVVENAATAVKFAENRSKDGNFCWVTRCCRSQSIRPATCTATTIIWRRWRPCSANTKRQPLSPVGAKLADYINNSHVRPDNKILVMTFSY